VTDAPISTQHLDRANAAFWDELCGTTFAQARQVDVRSAEGLRAFDRAYLDFYPYLLGYVRAEPMAGRSILEIGLGFGTLGQQIAEAGAIYHGVDVADGPVKMMAHRLRSAGLSPRVMRGSAYALPFPAAIFDVVVSIGCLHHTGRLQASIAEIHRVLRDGGRAIVMLYNEFSYRQWMRSPLRTATNLLRERRGSTADRHASVRERRLYDVNSGGVAAPETVLVSRRRVAQLFERYSDVAIAMENCDDVIPGGRWLSLRRRLLAPLGRRAGLDLYVTARK